MMVVSWMGLGYCSDEDDMVVAGKESLPIVIEKKGHAIRLQMASIRCFR